MNEGNGSGGHSNHRRLTCLVMASVRDRKVIDTNRLNIQFVDVAKELPVLLAQVG